MQELQPFAPTRESFAELIGVSKRGLDKWLFGYNATRPRNQQEFREMPEPVRRLLILMLENPELVTRMQALAREHKKNFLEKK